MGGHAKTMLNKQLHFLDGMECLSEGKHLEVKDCMKEADGDKNYSVHSWLSLMCNMNYSAKQVHIQAVILGCTWLREHNPKVNWQTQKESMSHYLDKCNTCWMEVKKEH